MVRICRPLKKTKELTKETSVPLKYEGMQESSSKHVGVVIEAEGLELSRSKLQEILLILSDGTCSAGRHLGCGTTSPASRRRRRWKRNVVNRNKSRGHRGDESSSLRRCFKSRWPVSIIKRRLRKGAFTQGGSTRRHCILAGCLEVCRAKDCEEERRRLLLFVVLR